MAKRTVTSGERDALKIELTKLEACYNKKLADSDFNFWIDQFIEEGIDPNVLAGAVKSIIGKTSGDFMPSLPRVMNSCKGIRFQKNQRKRHAENVNQEEVDPKWSLGIRLGIKLLYSDKANKMSIEEYEAEMKKLGLEKQGQEVIRDYRQRQKGSGRCN